MRNQIRANHARAPTNALDAVHQDTGVRVSEGVGNERGRAGEMLCELSERVVLEWELELLYRYAVGEGDETEHSRNDMGDA